MKLRVSAFLAPFALLLGVMTLASPDEARAQDGVCTLCGVPTATVETGSEVPLTVSIESSIDFDKVLLTGTEGARVRLTPQGERLGLTGAELLGARAFAGTMVIRGEANRPIVVDMPEELMLESALGTSVRVESIAHDAPHNPTLDGNGTLIVNFGGDLVVTGETDGEFRGNLRVDVNYL